MRKKRTDVDFKQHELKITRVDGLLVHYLKKPGTVIDSVKFINTNGVLAVTGDYGNWIFCREFHPSADGYVSDTYWCEKLKISSKQEPCVYDSEIAKEEIKGLLEEDDGSLSVEEKEWLNELSCEADEGEYSYIAKAMDRPGSFDAECIPRGKRLDYALEAVFDAFDEICKRIQEGKANEPKEQNFDEWFETDPIAVAPMAGALKNGFKEVMKRAWDARK
jgi:hypothetical protein